MAVGHSYIEARLRDILAAARAAAPWPPERHERFEQAIGLIAALFHYETFAELQRLKELYEPLDPDAARNGAADSISAFTAFADAIEPVLRAANFEEIKLDAFGPRAQIDALSDLKIRASNAGIRAIRFFGRGSRMEAIERKVWFGLRRRRIEVESLDEVVLLVAFQNAVQTRRRQRRRSVRPGAALIKLFRGVGRHELVALHPGAMPAMHARDQFFLGVPALAGGLPLLLQIGPALTVIFTLIAAYFGASAVIDDAAYKRAIAATSGLIAVGGFVMRQWMKYQRQSLIYQKRLADTVYYRNVANNQGVLATLISEAEEQDVKEAALAYWALLSADTPMTKEALDKAAETLLQTRCGHDVDFEIQDALAKLERLNLVAREGPAYRAIEPDEALARLDEAWDNLFQHAKTSAQGARAR